MSKVIISKEQIEKDFLMYLNQEKILDDLESVVENYEKTVNDLPLKEKFPPPLRFALKIDLIKIKRISDKMHGLFVREPLTGVNIAKNIIFCAIQIIISSISLEKSDLQINPQFVHLEITKEIENLFIQPSHGLESVQGLLISKTTTAKYVRSSFHRCQTASCPLHKWQRLSEKFYTICPYCHGFMQEHIASTDAGEEICCQFISVKAFNTRGRFQALPVKVKDELCTGIDLQIGEEYIITGILNDKYFNAYNVQPILLHYENYIDFPDSIKNLHFKISQSCENCPWSFVVALSSLLGSEVIPTSSFLNLKIALMLSLASLENGIPVPVVAVGTDSLNTEILFQAAGKLAEKCIKHSVAYSSLGGTIKPGIQSDVICQEAGTLILATKGICNLGDWSRFKKEQANYICQTIESGQILLNKDKFGKANLTNYVPLKCAVWTYWCNFTSSHNHQLQLKTLINVFGIPFPAEENDELELKKILWKNMSSARKNFGNLEKESVSVDDFKKFFKIINSREIILSEAASQLIRSYFVASRRDRHNCLPLGAIKTITSLAEAHVRLSLRNEVLYEDVAIIIFLYEDTMTSLYGESITPYRKLKRDDDEPIYVWMNKQMQQFCLWLEEYIATLN